MGNSELAEILAELRASFRLLQQGIIIAPPSHYVDFDTDPLGNPIANGTQLDVATNPYAPFGVSFAAIPAPKAGQLSVWARASLNSTTQPNIVSLQATPAGAGDTDEIGKIRINFSTTKAFVYVAARVSAPIEYLGALNWGPSVQGFDQNDNPVASSFFPAMTLKPGEVSAARSLAISSPSANIAYVVLSCSFVAGANNLVAYWDNLRFSL